MNGTQTDKKGVRTDRPAPLPLILPASLTWRDSP